MKWIVFLFLTFSVDISFAQIGSLFNSTDTSKCSIQLKLSDGFGCLSDYEFASKLDIDTKSRIVDIASRSISYVIAVAKDNRCSGISITTTRAIEAGDTSIDRALSSCTKSGCDCSLLISNGKVVNATLFEKYANIKANKDSIISQDSSVKITQVNEKKDSAEDLILKERQRKALESSEIIRLRAEAEESKRKQTELEEQLRLAKQQDQVSPPSAMTTMANRKALVIGNDTYKSVTKLLNAREDAKAIASNLTAVGYKVTLQLDLNEREMKAALRTFSSQVQGGDEVMFFFAGHGVQLGAANYLLPTDIGGESEAQVKDEAIQLQRVLDDMTDKKAKFTLAMIDACRDNPFKAIGRNIGGRGLAPTTAATGQMVVFSAGTGQQALDRLGSSDKNKNGVFTRTFLKEMQKPGLSIDRIIKNVRNELAALAKTIGHEQVPAIYDQVLGDFYFKK